MHHDSFSLSDVDTLLDVHEGPCVTLTLPTSAVTRGVDQGEGRIHLKNLRADAAEQLRASNDLREREIDALLEPVDELLEDEEFWRYLSDGLAVFLSPQRSATYRVALELPAQAVVGERFTFKSLLPLLTGDGTFYVLALSEEEVRLIEGTRLGAATVPVGEFPASRAHAMQRRGRDRGVGPNKQWQGDEGEKTLYRKYFLQVDRALRSFLGGSKAPVVLAGVDYLLPIFRGACSYRHLCDEAVVGSPDRLSPEDLHEKAWPLVEPVLHQDRRAALERLEGLVGSSRVSDELSTVLAAAYDGRVQSLFIDVNEDVFGHFDFDARQLEVHEAPQPRSTELVGLAARWVHARGGEVYVTEPDEPAVPARPLVAIMRY